jgi:hypothetical protein
VIKRPRFVRVHGVIPVVIFLVIDGMASQVSRVELIQDHAQHPGINLSEVLTCQSPGFPGSGLMFGYQQDSIRLKGSYPGVGEPESGRGIDNDVVKLPTEVLEKILVSL